MHVRLLTGDPLAASDLAAARLEPLADWLGRRFPAVDEHLIREVAIDLILDVAERPAQYDPNRRGLAGYLRMAAYRDVQNARRDAGRRARHETTLEVVEFAQRAGNSLVEGSEDPFDMIAQTSRLDGAQMAWLREQFDALEWRLVELRMDGERRWDVIGAELGLGDLPERERDRQIKRMADRVQKRLRRLAPRLRLDD